MTTRHSIIDVTDELADTYIAYFRIAARPEDFVAHIVDTLGITAKEEGEEIGSHGADDVMTDVMWGGKHYLIAYSKTEHTFSLEEIRAAKRV